MGIETSKERRSARRSRNIQSPLTRLPFQRLHNNLPALEMLDAGQVETLHEAAMRIPENTGIMFMNDEALDLWARAGARVDKTSKMVRIDRGLLLELVAHAPARFTWRARNPERDVIVGGNNITFAPNGGMAYASSLDSGRRPGTLQTLKIL